MSEGFSQKEIETFFEMRAALPWFKEFTDKLLEAINRDGIENVSPDAVIRILGPIISKTGRN